MNHILKKGILYSTAALIVSGSLAFAPFAGDESSTTGIKSYSSPIAAYAQAKKKPPAKGAPIQRQAGPNLNNPQVNGYLSRMRDKLDSNWELADGKNKVTITATVAADGSTSDVSTSSSPSNQPAEQAANEAFAKVQPLEAMPAAAGEKVKLTVTFDSFSGQHDSNRNITTRMDPIMSSSKPEDSGEAPK